MIQQIKEYRKRADGTWLPPRLIHEGFALDLEDAAGDVIKKRLEWGFVFKKSELKDNQIEAICGRDVRGNISKLTLEIKEDDTLPGAPKIDPSTIQIHDGIFTVVEGDEHRTFQTTNPRSESRNANPV